MLQPPQREKIIELTLHWCANAERLLELRLPQPDIRFDLGGRAAGQYRSGPAPCIRYNSAIAAAQFEAFCQRTPPHEVAHFAIDQVFGTRRVKPHGREWKALMQAFGCDASTCHDFDLGTAQIRRQRRFSYACACNRYELSATRHNRICNKGVEYRCRQCRQILRPVSTKRAAE